MSSSASSPPRVIPTSVPESDLASLLAQCAGGDSEALGALYDATSRFVYGLTLRILGDPAEAEEVVLDVYSQVWRQAGRFDAERGSPVAWLLMMARSRAIDRLRSRATARDRERNLDDSADLYDPADSPEDRSALAERSRLVRGALAALAPDQRRAIELAFFEGLTHGEIAQRLGSPLGTTKTRIRLGMLKLREALASLGDRP